MKSRFGFVGLAALAFLALGLGGTTLWAQPAAFTANGQGETIYTAGSCDGLVCSGANGSDCGCDETTGAITGTNFTGTFILKDQLLLTEGGISTGASNGTNVCYPSSGTLVITTASGAVLRMQFSGPACRVPNVNWSLVGGSYGIVSGTLRFANAIGTGTLSRAKDILNNSTTLSLVGNLSLTP